MEFYIAQGISIVTALVAILSMQLKNMKSILVFQITANLLAASTYFLLGGFSGAGISLIAIIQLIVMFFYNKKNTKFTVTRYLQWATRLSAIARQIKLRQIRCAPSSKRTASPVGWHPMISPQAVNMLRLFAMHFPGAPVLY